MFLRDLGHGAFALTVIGLAGCTAGPTSAQEPPGSFDPLTYVGNLDEIEAFWCDPSFDPPTAPLLGPAPARWARFGNGARVAPAAVATPGYAGYVLVRGGEATVIDTGPWCTPDAIEGGLMAVGLDWSAVGSVIVTHKHPDRLGRVVHCPRARRRRRRLRWSRGHPAHRVAAPGGGGRCR